jgi:hypothetical protein
MNESNPASSPSEREQFFEALGKTSKEIRSDFLNGAWAWSPAFRRSPPAKIGTPYNSYLPPLLCRGLHW